MSDLLERFIQDECNAFIRRLLEDAIEDSTMTHPHFEFNLFDVTIEREEKAILLEDLLDATQAGLQRVPIEAFLVALRKCQE